MILADADTTADGTLDGRTYYVQNWRHDVVATLDASGRATSFIDYTPYGEPIDVLVADFDRDGDVDLTDNGTFGSQFGTTDCGPSGCTGDFDRDGDVDGDDQTYLTAEFNGDPGAGSLMDEAEGRGYGGYVADSAVEELAHVRNRVYQLALGGWLTRDPIRYDDGPNMYSYTRSSPQNYLDVLGLKRHVVAIEGWGTSIGLSEEWVGPKSNMRLRVADLVDEDDWHYYDWTDSTSAKEKVVEIKEQSNLAEGQCGPPAPIDTVIVLGYSNGGDKAHEIVDELDSEDVKVDLLFMVDPVRSGVLNGIGSAIFGHTYRRPSNATRAVNIYQRVQDPKGHSMKGANYNKKFSKKELKKGRRAGSITSYHVWIIQNTEARDLFREWVERVPTTIGTDAPLAPTTP